MDLVEFFIIVMKPVVYFLTTKRAGAWFIHIEDGLLGEERLDFDSQKRRKGVGKTIATSRHHLIL
jgi:hypothetical protein